MELIETLTPELRSVVRKFCSHPTADVLRDKVVDWKGYSITLPEDQTYPDANTFYMYYFAMTNLTNIMTAIEQLPEMSGVHVTAFEMALRPKL